MTNVRWRVSSWRPRTSGNRTPARTSTAKSSSMPASNSMNWSARPVRRSIAQTPHFSSCARAVMGRPPKTAALPHLRQAHEGVRPVEGQAAGEAGQLGHRVTLAGGGIDDQQPAGARFEQPQPAGIQPGRVGHRQATADHPAGGHLDQDAAVGLLRPPALLAVGLAQGGDVSDPAVPDREAVEVAAVLVGQGGDERGPPAGDEAVVGAEGAQAGEAGVDDPQLVPLTPPLPTWEEGGGEGAAQAISWLRMSPVTYEMRGRKQASYLPAGSSCRAMSGALRKNQT